MEKIRISEDLCNYIEALHYETNAMQDLLVRMKNNTDEELNNFWLNKYIEKYTEYNLAKQELEEEYIVPKFGKNCPWELKFRTFEVIINENNREID